MHARSRAGARPQVSAVVTRADGSVEDWGRIERRGLLSTLAYAVARPVTIINRQRWRLRQWFRKRKTQD